MLDFFVGAFGASSKVPKFSAAPSAPNPTDKSPTDKFFQNPKQPTNLFIGLSVNRQINLPWLLLAFRDRNLRRRPYAEIVRHPVSELVWTWNDREGWFAPAIGSGCHPEQPISFKNDLWEDLKFWSEKSWVFFYKKKPSTCPMVSNPFKGDLGETIEEAN